MLLLQEEKAAKPEHDDRYYDVLYHPGREITNATLRGFGRPSIYIALTYEVLLSLAADPFTWTNRSIPPIAAGQLNLNALWHAIFFSNLVFLVVLLFLISYAEIVRITKEATLKQRYMQTTPDGAAQQSVDIGFALRIKSLAPTQRKVFFAHLKGAQQVHFANTIAEPGKSKVTSIHPPGAGGVQSKHAVSLYRDEASRLQRRLRKLAGKLLVSGTINRADF
jgi:hypothetical protein